MESLTSDPEALLGVLKSHVLDQKVRLFDLPVGRVIVKNLNGEDVEIEVDAEGMVTVSTPEGVAKVVQGNIRAANGAIHVIDTVL